MTEKQIEDLIEKYANNVATDDEISRLMDWYNSSSKTEIRWPGSKKKVYNRIKNRLQASIKTKENGIIIFPWPKVAAALVVIVGAALILSKFTKPAAAEMVTVINPPGMIKELELPDGSKLWLNAQTKLRYHNAFPENREVELDGEAYFEVVHDPQHPFRIKTGELKTIVLGTRFTIKNYQEDSLAEISLLSGKIEVERETGESTILKPLTKLSFNRHQKLANISPVDTSSMLAWKSGKLQFDSETLGGITEAIGRWYGVDFAFADSSAKSCRYYMGFDNQMALAKVLTAMEELTGLRYSINKNIVTVVGNACQ